MRCASLKAYPGNLTFDGYQLLSDLLPRAKPDRRPRSVKLWDVFNVIFHALVEGVRWRALPDDFPAWQTLYTYFRNWRRNETWLSFHDRLYCYSCIDQALCCPRLV